MPQKRLRPPSRGNMGLAMIPASYRWSFVFLIGLHLILGDYVPPPTFIFAPDAFTSLAEEFRPANIPFSIKWWVCGVEGVEAPDVRFP